MEDGAVDMLIDGQVASTSHSEPNGSMSTGNDVTASTSFVEPNESESNDNVVTASTSHCETNESISNDNDVKTEDNTRSIQIHLEECEPNNYERYRRMLVYHCYRSHQQASDAAKQLCERYGNDFINENFVQQLYDIIGEVDFDFNSFMKKSYNLIHKDNQTDFDMGEYRKDDNGQQLLCAQELKEFVKATTKTRSKQPLGIISLQENINSSKNQQNQLNKKEGPIFPTFDDDMTGIEGPYNKTMTKKIRLRQLYLHCFEAKYSATEAVEYLNSIYGKNFCTKASVCGWYRRFNQNDFELVDQSRRGRHMWVEEEKLGQFMDSNPTTSVTHLCEIFQITRKTVHRSLARLGYRYVVDKWEKIDPNSVGSDQQLLEYKTHNPDASVREISEIFKLNSSVVAKKLRSFGFEVPKWPPKRPPGVLPYSRQRKRRRNIRLISPPSSGKEIETIDLSDNENENLKDRPVVSAGSVMPALLRRKLMGKLTPKLLAKEADNEKCTNNQSPTESTATTIVPSLPEEVPSTPFLSTSTTCDPNQTYHESSQKTETTNDNSCDQSIVYQSSIDSSGQTQSIINPYYV
ncbi:hypothetical protein RDWZM_002068 [Blomia tropicalis]|uniref:Mos1 transposase HTH domain-containing protein n=1 Tax=Blomia tropicalis TaxID=40697 RepID=A0A9Q0RPK2_BLOTA|nr:hypothetical protein BLOT_002319 [Blomia tropicalis]KAJ6223523.1 hypothetical protein RDWZM_002068 [Blomia tropicalis]